MFLCYLTIFTLMLLMTSHSGMLLYEEQFSKMLTELPLLS